MRCLSAGDYVPPFYMMLEEKLTEEARTSECVAGRLALDLPGLPVSHDTIYSGFTRNGGI
jgi:hypothetical protein